MPPGSTTGAHCQPPHSPGGLLTATSTARRRCPPSLGGAARTAEEDRGPGADSPGHVVTFAVVEIESTTTSSVMFELVRVHVERPSHRLARRGRAGGIREPALELRRPSVGQVDGHHLARPATRTAARGLQAAPGLGSLKIFRRSRGCGGNPCSARGGPLGGMRPAPARWGAARNANRIPTAPHVNIWVGACNFVLSLKSANDSSRTFPKSQKRPTFNSLGWTAPSTIRTGGSEASSSLSLDHWKTTVKTTGGWSQGVTAGTGDHGPHPHNHGHG